MACLPFACAKLNSRQFLCGLATEFARYTTQSDHRGGQRGHGQNTIRNGGQADAIEYVRPPVASQPDGKHVRSSSNYESAVFHTASPGNRIGDHGNQNIVPVNMNIAGSIIMSGHPVTKIIGGAGVIGDGLGNKVIAALVVEVNVTIARLRKFAELTAVSNNSTAARSGPARKIAGIESSVHDQAPLSVSRESNKNQGTQHQFDLGFHG